jgi:hypothetical protein
MIFDMDPDLNRYRGNFQTASRLRISGRNSPCRADNTVEPATKIAHPDTEPSLRNRLRISFSARTTMREIDYHHEFWSGVSKRGTDTVLIKRAF